MNLRKAAEQALEALSEYEKSYPAVADAFKPLRAALAEDRSADTGKTSDHFADAGKMVATIRPEVTVEPVAWSYTDARGRTVVVIANTAPYDDAKPLYAAPPKREPLTDWEIEVWAQKPISRIALCRAIERRMALGVRNDQD